MKVFSCQRPRDRPIRTDQPKMKAQLLCNRQSKRMPPSRNQHDFNASIVHAAQCPEIDIRNLKLRVKQGAVNIDSQEPHRSSHFRDSSSTGEDARATPKSFHTNDKSSA